MTYHLNLHKYSFICSSSSGDRVFIDGNNWIVHNMGLINTSFRYAQNYPVIHSLVTRSQLIIFDSTNR